MPLWRIEFVLSSVVRRLFGGHAVHQPSNEGWETKTSPNWDQVTFVNWEAWS